LKEAIGVLKERVDFLYEHITGKKPEEKQITDSNTYV
jgi:hypothetical protein